MLTGIEPGRDLFTVRAVAGVEAARAEIQAFVWNVGTERPDAKGEVRGEDPRRASVPMRDAGADRFVVFAGQRMDLEGSSPSGARMRGVVSKGGGNASPARERGRYGET